MYDKILTIALFVNLAIFSFLLSIGVWYYEIGSAYFSIFPALIFIISAWFIFLKGKDSKSMKSCCSTGGNDVSKDIPDGYILDRENFDTVVIAYGCLICNSCETIFPKAFKVFEDHTEVLGLVRVDGKSSDNFNDLSKITDEYLNNRELFREVADGCCVEVIKLLRKNDDKNTIVKNA